MKQPDPGRSTLEHRWAQVTAAATFFLLMAGGLVNPTGSSLACPEALVVCHGQLFPELTGGVLYEHGHRLIAMTVGLLQLGLTALLFRRRPALRGWAAGALGLVVVQALLGALTVKLKLPWFVSTAHLMVAMTYFAMVLVQAWRTRPAPMASPAPADAAIAAERARLRRWIAIGGGAILLQILLGGLVRHHGAALASVDLPLHEGQLWPAGPLALKLHMAHRILGVVVGLVAIAASIAIARGAGPGRAGVRRAALVVPVAIVAQVLLGLGIVYTFRSVPVVVFHFGGAALLWALFCGMWLMTSARGPAARRAGSPRHAPTGALAGAGRSS